VTIDVSMSKDYFSILADIVMVPKIGTISQ